MTNQSSGWLTVTKDFGVRRTYGSKKTFESHAENLGKLVGNLLSLELAARMAIVKLDTWAAAQVQTQLPQAKEDDWVGINAFTNGDDLRRTLEKFNKRTTPECRVDVDPVVKLRDALAHGRMFGYGQRKPDSHLRLLKFSSKKADNKVQVTLAVDMTTEWFRANIKLLVDALSKIAKALDYEIGEIK